MGYRWGEEGPPDEAYSRVTDPQRFEPIQPVALALIDELESEFDVTREEGWEFGLDFPNADFIHPSVRLHPNGPSAAPITFSFPVSRRHSIPGVVIQAGHWLSGSYPMCGCDACDETVEGLLDEMHFLVRAVVSGQLVESVDLPKIGVAWTDRGWWVEGRSSGGGSRITRAEAARLISEAGGKEFTYSPWPRRPGR